MRTLDEILGRCVPDDVTGCKLWVGATDKAGAPRLYAPDPVTGRMKTGYGRRAVWQLVNGALPKGWEVFGVCGNPACLEPSHMRAMTRKNWGKRVAAIGDQRGNIARIVANRRLSRERSRLTQETLAYILASPKSGLALSDELGICRNTISRARTGKLKAFQPVGGLFSGLLR